MVALTRTIIEAAPALSSRLNTVERRARGYVTGIGDTVVGLVERCVACGCVAVLPHTRRRALIVEEVLLLSVAGVVRALRPRLHLPSAKLLCGHTRCPAVLEHEQIRVGTGHVCYLLA